MTIEQCERAVLIEPVAPVVYLKKRSHCKWWPLVVVVLFVMATGGFLVQVKAVVSDLKVQVDGLKSENLRLANKLEALAISDLKAEVAELKDEVVALKEEDLHLWDEAWRNAMADHALGSPSKYSYAQIRQLWRAYPIWFGEKGHGGTPLSAPTPKHYRHIVTQLRAKDKTRLTTESDISRLSKVKDWSEWTSTRPILADIREELLQWPGTYSDSELASLGTSI
tara:strand:+ start:903 stop:1574 length:672 start_codon:yes stop_codon:yes gene_type:complete